MSNDPHDPPRRPTNGWATAALVLGVCSLVLPVLGIVAIVGGLAALPKSRDRGGKGKAVGGIVFGLLGVIGGTVFAILTIHQMRTYAGQHQCQENLRQMMPGISAYLVDNKNAYPPDLQTLQRLQYVVPTIPTCPAGHSYTYVAQGQRTTRIAKPSVTVIMYDAPGAHSRGQMIALFADGHSELLTEADTRQVLTDVAAGKLPPMVGTGLQPQ